MLLWIDVGRQGAPGLTTQQGARPQHWLQIGAAMLVAAPGPALRLLEITDGPHPELSSGVESAIFGVSILAAATLLVWASEVAEQLISATLALALLAIIAVLPEYAVDLYFAWTAADNPDNAQFALANMTGANRLLVGFAWPAVFFLFWFRQRKPDLAVGRENALSVVFLGLATIYSFSLPARQHLSLIDSGVLIGIFLVYLVLVSRAPPREAELVGPAQTIASLPLKARWAVVLGLFGYAAAVVFAAAEPFAEGLVDSGEALGIEEFLLVQWVAPLASEAPEFLLAAMLALRGRAAAAMTLLISSKVNQWTLLVGSLPVAFSISGATISPLDMDARQAEEVFLTAGQSLFAVAVLTSLSFNFREAALIFLLFATQLVLPNPEVRIGIGAAYILLALVWFFGERRDILPLFRSAHHAALQPTGNPHSSPDDEPEDGAGDEPPDDT
jgi:cation:H+ antiporter